MKKKILVSHLSFKENHVIHSDQLILFEERNRQMQIRVDYEQVHQSASMIKQKGCTI